MRMEDGCLDHLPLHLHPRFHVWPDVDLSLSSGQPTPLSQVTEAFYVGRGAVAQQQHVVASGVLPPGSPRCRRRRRTSLRPYPASKDRANWQACPYISWLGEFSASFSSGHLSL